MSGRKLAANVYVGGELYREGTSPAKEIADQITNPKAWGADTASGDDGKDDGKSAARPSKPAKG